MTSLTMMSKDWYIKSLQIPRLPSSSRISPILTMNSKSYRKKRKESRVIASESQIRRLSRNLVSLEVKFTR